MNNYRKWRTTNKNEDIFNSGQTINTDHKYTHCWSHKRQLFCIQLVVLAECKQKPHHGSNSYRPFSLQQITWRKTGIIKFNDFSNWSKHVKNTWLQTRQSESFEMYSWKFGQSLIPTDLVGFTTSGAVAPV